MPTQSIVIRFLLLVLTILFFPFAFLLASLKQKQTIFRTVLTFLTAIFFLLPLWLITIGSIGFMTWYLLTIGGVFTIPVPVSGSSMLPTITDKSYIALHRYPGFTFIKRAVQKGDIVVFENEKTTEEIKKQHKTGGGFVKRVIGIPGDKILIKDGYVYANDQRLAEPYTLKPRSTFGSTATRDCQEITVPKDHIFVLGDNRKRSEDSRHIGLVSVKDISYLLPFAEQKNLAQQWRNTDQDQLLADSSVLNVGDYLKLVNEKRAKHGLPALRYENKLSLSAQKRAEVMLSFDDFSFTATRSGYTMDKAVQEAGYSNIVYGELPTLGYYDAQELVDYFFEFADSEQFLLSTEYQEIGISTFVGNLAGCPTQIVVQHLGGYVPPNYTKDVINGWKNVVVQLQNVQPGWAKLKENTSFYEKNKSDIDNINNLIATRLQRIQQIVSRMEKNEWLTTTEKQYIEEDKNLYEQQQKVAEKLNSQ